MALTQTFRAWERYGWAAGIIFVAALVAESVVSVGIGATQNDSASKIANALYAHRSRLLAVACLSIIYAIAFVIYLWRLHDLLGSRDERSRSLGPLLLIGGVLFITLHSVSDIGITGMLSAKLGTYSAHHDPGLAYSLYLTTYALDSVADVFGSLFFIAAGLLVLRTAMLSRWLGRVAVGAGVVLVVQGFGLGGVIATFGLVVDLIGFLLLLTFVLVSSISLLRREVNLALS